MARRSGDWWNERVREYVASRGGASTNWQRQTLRLLYRWPETFAKIGQPKPEGPTDVTAAMVTAFKEDGRFAQNSKQAYISRLHGFLKWAKTDIAKDEEQNEELWAVSAGKASHRRWLTRPQVNALLDVAKDRERLVIVLGAWQGLRAIEIARLHWRDVNMDAGSPTLTVLGKGQHGGKEATLAMNRLVWQELLPLSRGKKPSDPVYPAGYGRIDKDCRAVAKRAGIPFSAHDLRRAFGRIAYYDLHVPLVTIQRIYRHEDIGMTSYYIGLDEEEVREGLDLFAASWHEPAPLKVRTTGVSTTER